jgi:preprotein translocase subunit SecB
LVDNDPSRFAVEFKVDIANQEIGFSLIVQLYAIFLTKGVTVTDEFINSEIATRNASAIVFPYMRMYITNFCQNSGFNPQIMPGYNFTHLVRAPE